MNNKEKYYQAMKNDNGRLDEIELGEKIGLEEDETRKMISMLLSEYRIDFITNRQCNYKVKNVKSN